MLLDETDRRILRHLQRDGRISNTDLAEKVGLSPSPCLRRVRLLEEAGLIKGYFAEVDAGKLDMGTTIFARIWLTGQTGDIVDAFIREVSRLPNVQECFLMAGDCDFILRVVAKDLKDYRQFQIDHLTRLPGVANIKSELPMEVVKLTHEVPV